jgi:serine/threonine protein kinase
MKPHLQIELLSKLGEGAYGCVHQARVITTGETVAVKSIKITADEEGVSSTTLREMTILENLNHPNVVKYFPYESGY